MSACSPMVRDRKKAGATQRQQLADRDREIERLRADNAGLRAQVAALLARVADLEEKVRANSSNSSKPPSSDPPGAHRPPKKAPSGRRPGGQPGHKGTTRALVPPEQVDHFNDVTVQGEGLPFRHPAEGHDCQHGIRAAADTSTALVPYAHQST